MIFILICLSSFENAFSQNKFNENPEKCKKEFSQFYHYAKVKDYDLAYNSWKWCFENCPTFNKNIYYYGLKIAQDRYDKASDKNIASQLIDDIYTQRTNYFPKNLSKIYSDWATSLEKRGVSKEKVFEKLELAFNADPSGLSIRNMTKFFEEVTIRNKDTNAQKVFDTYDDILEAVNIKIDNLTKKLDEINTKELNGQTLTHKEKREQKNNTINLRVLGRAENALNQIHNEIATCDRLLLLCSESLEANKKDVKWLRRMVSRLYLKECTENNLFKKLLDTYSKADYSPEVLIIYQDIFENKAVHKFPNELNELINLEKDSYKKAEYFYKIARTMHGSQARTYARRALKHRPSMGKAYLLIARLYARSANSCGTDEFSKRMVFVAAADKARKAIEVDPSITATANKYIKSYIANSPRKIPHPINSKKEFYIKCWIGETVIIP